MERPRFVLRLNGNLERASILMRDGTLFYSSWRATHRSCMTGIPVFVGVVVVAVVVVAVVETISLRMVVTLSVVAFIQAEVSMLTFDIDARRDATLGSTARRRLNVDPTDGPVQ